MSRMLACALALASPGVSRAEEPVRVPLLAEAPGQREDEFPVALGSYATSLIGSHPERTANIRLAAEALDGALIEPGALLSFDAVVGPRTVERGYQQASVILHERRQTQTGGGVCQVASTVFVAGLASGLSVVERWKHSTPVDYCPLGHDATIAWRAKDLKLRNDLDQRVRLRVELLGGTLVARVEAERPLTMTFDLVSDERELPAEPGLDGARSGREVDVFRVRRVEGAEVDRELLHRDVYPPSRGARRPGS